MGLNVDLQRMLALPGRVLCPKCVNELDARFDDYDIECGNPNPRPGVWELSCYCPTCEHDFKYCFAVAPLPMKRMEHAHQFVSLADDPSGNLFKCELCKLVWSYSDAEPGPCPVR